MSENNTLVPNMRFFKVLVPGFESKLRLPTAFCAKFRGKLSSQSVVTTQIGKWKIKVRKCRGGHYFQGGHSWDSFVKKHELTVGDFIVFEHHDNMHFSVHVFGPSACEKEFLDKAKKMPQEIVGKSHEHGTISLSPSSSIHLPPFRRTITAQSAANNTISAPVMNIPVEIWKSIDLHKKEYVIRRVPASGRREWPVKLRYQKDGERRGWGPGRLSMTKGWLDFAKFNNLKKGDVCTFEIIVGEFDDGDVVKINVTIIPA